MALIKCPECGKEISDRVKSCPHCGYPVYEEMQQIQPVELASVNIAPKGSMARKKLITVVVLLIVISSICIGTWTTVNEKKAKEAAKEEAATYNTYIDNIIEVSNTMVDCAAKAGEITEKTHDVWYNSIHRISDRSTDRYTKDINGWFFSDFNDAIAKLYDDALVKKRIGEVQSNKEEVGELMKKIQNPPAELSACYDSILEMYGEYQTLAQLAISPSGSLQSFTDDINSTTSSFINCYNTLLTQIPEKSE